VENILLSVVIPVYNAELFIEKTIDSITCQLRKQFEIIAVNDGSTDRSLDILNKLSTKYDVLKIVNQENKGATFARNNGLSHAQGKYIIFFDSDDVFENDVLTEMVDLIEKEESDLLLCNYSMVDKNLNEISKVVIDDNLKICKNELLNTIPFPGNKIYSLDIIKKYKILFDPVKIGQDLNFFLKYCAFVNKVSIYKKSAVKYRILSSSISNSYDSRIIEIVKSMNYTFDFYKSIGKYNEYVEILDLIALKHYVFQFSKLRFINDKYLRNRLLRELKRNIFKSIKPLNLSKIGNIKFVIRLLLSYYKTRIIILIG